MNVGQLCGHSCFKIATRTCPIQHKHTRKQQNKKPRKKNQTVKQIMQTIAGGGVAGASCQTKNDDYQAAALSACPVRHPKTGTRLTDRRLSRALQAKTSFLSSPTPCRRRLRKNMGATPALSTIFPPLAVINLSAYLPATMVNKSRVMSYLKTALQQPQLLPW